MHLDEARIAVRLAREAMEVAVNSGDRIKAPQNLPAIFDESRGVFVTLHSEALRGCVGYPYASKTIKDALIDAAISAALYDYRFPRVRAEELKRIRVEITLLTEPKRIDSPTDIVVGKHGIIVKKGQQQGLLLPQVATDFKWTQQEFLDQTYMKAGLSPSERNAEIFVFEGQVFSELDPCGAVVARSLD
ncbi:MAG: TIGR00296 family protein [Halobacteriota archaeon]